MFPRGSGEAGEGRERDCHKPEGEGASGRHVDETGGSPALYVAVSVHLT